MYTLKIQPEGGILYEITHHKNEFLIERIDGLCPPESMVNVSTCGLYDGGKYNSARMDVRNLIFTIVLRGDIDATRRKLYTIFPPKRRVTVYFSDGVRNVKIDGYVEQPDVNPFDFPEKMLISVLCPDPYWHDVTGISENFAGVGAKTVTNTGDAETGFVMRMMFAASVTPSVTLGEADEELNAEFPYLHHLFLRPLNSGTPVVFDPDTQKITELTASTTDITDWITDVDIVTKQDDISGTNAEDFIHVYFQADVLNAGAFSVRYAIAGISGGSAENLVCKVRTTTDFSGGYYAGGVYYENCNMNFQGLTLGTDLDPATDKYTVYGRYASVGWVDLTSQCTIVGGTNLITAQFLYDIVNAGCLEGKIVIYHDTTGADIRSTLTLDYYTDYRNIKTDWSANCYDSIPAGYDPEKDVPYINGVRITAADIVECYILQGGTVQAHTIVYGDPGSAVDFRYVYSLTSADIRSYTDDQIDAGLSGTAFTHGVCVWNNTTGKWMYFKNTRFQIGDIAEFSTVPGNLYAKIVKRNGADADISVMADVYKNGQFFPLVAGENQIELTADSGGEYLSAVLTAERLFGGV